MKYFLIVSILTCRIDLLPPYEICTDTHSNGYISKEYIVSLTPLIYRLDVDGHKDHLKVAEGCMIQLKGDVAYTIEGCTQLKKKLEKK